MFELGYMDYQPIAFGFIDSLYLSSLEVCLLYAFLCWDCIIEYRKQESVDKGICRNKYDSGTFALHSFSRATVPSIVFYNLHNCAAVHFIEADNSSYLCSNRKDSTYIYMKNIAETYWKRKKMPIPHLLLSDYEGRNVWKP